MGKERERARVRARVREKERERCLIRVVVHFFFLISFFF